MRYTWRMEDADLSYVLEFAGVLRKAAASGGKVEIMACDVLARAIEVVCDEAERMGLQHEPDPFS